MLSAVETPMPDGTSGALDRALAAARMHTVPFSLGARGRVKDRAEQQLTGRFSFCFYAKTKQSSHLETCLSLIFLKCISHDPVFLVYKPTYTGQLSYYL